jgi:DNA-binding HxlR family transcriptional regulator
MEVLDERWTMLVIRELIQGSSRFNEIRRGVPKMSPALLSKRLRSLERAGVVERVGSGSRTAYALTAAGRELEPLVIGLGVWGLRWIGDLGEGDLDPHLLFWDMRRTIPVQAWPRQRTVLEVRLSDVAPVVSRWWFVVSGGEVDVCDVDPGYEVTASMGGSLRDLARIWRGELAWPRALRTGAVTVDGPATVRRAVPQWLGISTIASVAAAQPRPA